MAKLSKELMRVANIVPRLRLATKGDRGVQGTGPHKVTFLEDKLGRRMNPDTGLQEEIVKYYFEEDGERKMYVVPVKDKSGELHYLVRRLSEIDENEKLIIQYKRKGLKGFIEVLKISEQSHVDVNDDMEHEDAEEVIEIKD